jgi:hypothetical protein
VKWSAKGAAVEMYIRRHAPVGFPCSGVKADAITNGGPSPSRRYGRPGESEPSVTAATGDTLRTLPQPS